MLAVHVDEEVADVFLDHNIQADSRLVKIDYRGLVQQGEGHVA